MIIACLAFGSLVWDPRDLPFRPPWFTDGPEAGVEFARVSRNGRLTLVLDRESPPVPLLWARMAVEDLELAMAALRNREEIASPDWRPLIGRWQGGERAPVAIPGLADWAAARGIDAVIWTALRPLYRPAPDAEPVAAKPPAEWVLAYLSGLEGETRARAETYIRRAPAQVTTPYRRRIEAALGWTPMS